MRGERKNFFLSSPYSFVTRQYFGHFFFFFAKIALAGHEKKENAEKAHGRVFSDSPEFHKVLASRGQILYRPFAKVVESRNLCVSHVMMRTRLDEFC